MSGANPYFEHQIQNNQLFQLLILYFTFQVSSEKQLYDIFQIKFKKDQSLKLANEQKALDNELEQMKVVNQRIVDQQLEELEMLSKRKDDI